MKKMNKMFKFSNNEELLLLSKASQKTKEWLLAHPEYKNFWALLKYKYYLRKFHKGIPIAYILGYKDFYNLDFLVNKYTLIPRPDTETLVDATIDEISNIQFPISNTMLIDVGTGTGCIPITILKRLQDLKNLKIDAIATDISKCALKVAKKNAKKHNIEINFLHGDLLSPILQFCNSACRQAGFAIFKSIVITANLPYLKVEWWKNEPSIQYEPKSALVSDDETGLYLYDKFLQQIQTLQYLIFNIQYLILLEIDPRQSSEIFKLIQKYLPEASIEFIKDLSGFDRVVKIKIS